MPHVQQDVLTLFEDLSSLTVFGGICIAQSLVFCLPSHVFCCLSFPFLSFFAMAMTDEFEDNLSINLLLESSKKLLLNTFYLHTLFLSVVIENMFIHYTT